MKFIDIKAEDVTDELLKKAFFSAEKPQYDSADFMMVFGCRVKRVLDDRLECALEIIREKKVGEIVLSGGIGVCGDFNESEYMLNYLTCHGVDRERLLLENKSATTEQNIENSLSILGKNGGLDNHSLVAVSDCVHIRRIEMELKHYLKNFNSHLLCDYPSVSLISFEHIRMDEVRNYALNEISKIQRLISNGIICDEEI